MSPAVAALWLLGCGLFLVRWLAGLWLLKQRELRARCLDDAHLLDLLDRSCKNMQIRCKPDLRLEPGGQVPATWGFRKCKIFLPASYKAWADEEKQMALLHELAHLRRRDASFQAFAAIVCALQWFNPFVWRGFLRLIQTAEHASDDLVLRCGAKPSAYASFLAAIATSSKRSREWISVPAMATAGRSAFLRLRIIDILNSRRARRPPRAAVRLSAFALALSGAIVAAGVGPATLLALEEEKQAVLFEMVIVEGSVPESSWSRIRLNEAEQSSAAEDLIEVLTDLEVRGHLRVLSAPRVTTLNGQEAGVVTGIRDDGGGTVRLRLSIVPREVGADSIEMRVKLAREVKTGSKYEVLSASQHRFVVADGSTSYFENPNVDGNAAPNLLVFVTARRISLPGAVPAKATAVHRSANSKDHAEPITVSLADADLVETLQAFAKIADLKLEIDQRISGKVTLELKEMPWDQALEQILETNRLSMEIEGATARITLHE